MNGELPDFFEWYKGQSEAWKHRPWLILGKGPTFSRFDAALAHDYSLFALNHVVQRVDVDIVHAIDLDVIDQCADALLSRARFVVMPWYPHVRNWPGRRSLAGIARSHPVLRRLAEQGRLLWYNKSGSRPHATSPTVPVFNFSAEAAVAMLAMAGVRRIRTLGIDGGAQYATEFDPGTLLANGRPSFDSQFDRIARSIMTFNLDLSPLGAESPVRVFVGTAREQDLAVRVLAYSIRKHASVSTEIQRLDEVGIDVPMPREPANRPRTPFSFQRFLIPQAVGHRGRAIYLDSDMQVVSDIRHLWEADMGTSPLLCSKAPPDDDRHAQFAVMLLDCSCLEWDIVDIVRRLDAGEFRYEDLMQRMVIAPTHRPGISSGWNSLDRFVPGETRLIHYTNMGTQPWIHAGHPLGHLWMADLIEAVEEGHISAEDVERSVRNGWVRPSLAHQIHTGIADPLALSRKALAADEAFSPPYRKHIGARPNAMFAALRYVRGVALRASRSPRLERLRWIKRRWWG